MTTTDAAMTCRRCGGSRLHVIDHAPCLPLSYAQCDVCGYITAFEGRPHPEAWNWLLHRIGARVHPRLRSSLFAGMWVALAIWVVWADYLGAFAIPFPITYVLPVLFAANSGYRVLALALSFALPLARVEFLPPGLWTSSQDPLVNYIMQSFLLAFIAVLVDRHCSELRAWRALLPICAWCRRIRLEANRWQPIEAYVAERSHIQFTHGLCPECFQTHADDLDRLESRHPPLRPSLSTGSGP